MSLQPELKQTVTRDCDLLRLARSRRARRNSVWWWSVSGRENARVWKDGALRNAEANERRAECRLTRKQPMCLELVWDQAPFPALLPTLALKKIDWSLRHNNALGIFQVSIL